MVSPLALGASLLCAPLPGALGVFLVLRRQALMVDGLAHGLAPGTMLSHYLVGHQGFSLMGILFSGSFAFFLAWLMNTLGDKMREDKTSFMAVFSLISISVAFLDEYHEHGEMTSSLLKDISSSQFLGLFFLVLFLGFCFVGYYPRMVGECFDEDFAKTHGSKSPFLFFVTFALVLCSCVLGPVLALSLMILPALSTKRIFMHYFSKNLQPHSRERFPYSLFQSMGKFCLLSSVLSTLSVLLGNFLGESFSIVFVLIGLYGGCLLLFKNHYQCGY